MTTEEESVKRMGHDDRPDETTTSRKVWEEEEAEESPPSPQSWIRGVNLGGWLLLERYVTPYQFALTTCHVAGDFCWYPGQINAPPNAELCDIYRCKPVMDVNAFGQMDYPMDEYTLWKSFGTNNNNTQAAEQWLNYHLEYFITEADVLEILASGATHIRVPLAHWILDSQEEIWESGQVWIVGKRWEAFQRLVEWSRKHGLQVWPDIHTAPGSQNGFDNSGTQLAMPTCLGWMNNDQNIEDDENVQKSLQVIRDVTQRIMDDDMRDVVTGFGLVNEPFRDCPRDRYLQFLELGLDIVRSTMGEDTYVYVSDLFQPETFNDGTWWLDPQRYHRTFLDTHYYHVFSETTRAISPRQHIALTCQNEYHNSSKAKKTQGGVTSCCWQDGPLPNPTQPSHAVQRMVGEWSVAVDTLPMDMLYAVLQNVAETGTALHLTRQIDAKRHDFLRHFAQAQMVIYEAADQAGISGAWFYWTVKMEGGAFAEWDFLRGIREGWIPRIPADATTSSTSLYGTCYEIMAQTSDEGDILHEYPEPVVVVPPPRSPKVKRNDDDHTNNDDDDDNWQGMALDDDVVVSHGKSILLHHMTVTTSSSSTKSSLDESSHPTSWVTTSGLGIVVVVVLLVFGIGWYRRHRNYHRRNKAGYMSLPQQSSSM
ncbi:hypothetical protein ACA910_021899 [Epithemia clementina (nom. ined.)]